MKIRSLLLATAFSLAAVAAQAATTDLGTTYLNETGTITDSVSSTGVFSDVITGLLSPNEKITFSYKLIGFTPGSLTADAMYKYDTLGIVYSGSASAISGSTPISQGFTNPQFHPNHLSPSTALVFATANLSKTAGTTTISNSSYGVASFTSVLVGDLKKSGAVIIKYTVSALSAVPLPASAPLFGLGLAMLAGMGIRKRSASNKI